MGQALSGATVRVTCLAQGQNHGSRVTGDFASSAQSGVPLAADPTSPLPFSRCPRGKPATSTPLSGRARLLNANLRPQKSRPECGGCIIVARTTPSGADLVWVGGQGRCLGSCWHRLTASLPSPGSVLWSGSASPMEPTPGSRLAQVQGRRRKSALRDGSRGTCSIFLAPWLRGKESSVHTPA